MNRRELLTEVDTGITTALLVGLLVVELLDVEFAAIVGRPVGLLAGVGVVALLAVSFDDLGPAARRAASGYAAFGLTVLVLFALGYVNVGGSRSVLSVDVVAGVAAATAVVVTVVLWHQDRSTPS